MDNRKLKKCIVNTVVATKVVKILIVLDKLNIDLGNISQSKHTVKIHRLLYSYMMDKHRYIVEET